MESTLTVGESTRRPGGRTAKVSRRINDAVLKLLVEGGIEACTFAAVAERAAVERSTLYRRYEDRWAMMIDAILDYSADEASPVSLGSIHSPDVVFPSSARPIKAPREKSWSNRSRSAVQARSTPLGSVISTQSAPV